jgi:hypothetical protein
MKWISAIELLPPDGSRVSRLAGCALIGSVYNKRYRRRHAPYLLGEGQSPPPRELSGGLVPTAGWACVFNA